MVGAKDPIIWMAVNPYRLNNRLPSNCLSFELSVLSMVWGAEEHLNSFFHIFPSFSRGDKVITIVCPRTQIKNSSYITLLFLTSQKESKKESKKRIQWSERKIRSFGWL